MAEKLKVLFQVSEARKGDFGVTSRKPVLEFTGEVDLTLEELRKVLSYVVVGSASQQALFGQSLSEPNVKKLSHLEAAGIKALTEQDDWSYDQEISITEPLPPKLKRKSPRPKTSLVCQRCGRKFKGFTSRQKCCGKDDCKIVAAARHISAPVSPVRKSQKGMFKNYPPGREAPTPLTPAVCQRCGRDYMAYSKAQKRCNRPDCKKVAAKQLRWQPQATIVAGQGVLAGTV